MRRKTVWVAKVRNPQTNETEIVERARWTRTDGRKELQEIVLHP